MMNTTIRYVALKVPVVLYACHQFNGFTTIASKAVRSRDKIITNNYFISYPGYIGEKIYSFFFMNLMNNICQYSEIEM